VYRILSALSLALAAAFGLAAELPPPFPHDSHQDSERTCFQTGSAWSGTGNLRSDVAIVYGIDAGLPQRIATWRNRGYRIHVMTGVAWGNYQDYLDGRFDGVNHQDEAQTDRRGNPHRHGDSRDIFYMCPGTNYGKYLCVGVKRALEAGAEAIHLEEPEFWVQDGYEEGFRREWQAYYQEKWQPPHSSVDAQWRASKLKYFLYRRALQQVFDFVQDYNRLNGKSVRCYVPTHSLLNYAHWRIVSPESSLARLEGCDGYIAQVWTGTSRTPNLYRGKLAERTFETAFLEYGAMQNLVRATGRRVWYLNDPVEDDPSHDWEDYRRNWESTLVASLFQPEVWRFEVAPWPERVFGGRYPAKAGEPERVAIPPRYATELQAVMNALNDMDQPQVEWDCGTEGVGVVVSDSLMFERGGPTPSDAHLSHIYGLALPLLNRGIPVTPVQLENLTAPHYLDRFRLLLLTYQGQKPLSQEVHAPLVKWVKDGGALLVVDDDSDPYNTVREWWNTSGRSFPTPREALFQDLGLTNSALVPEFKPSNVGKGLVMWVREDPARLAALPDGDRKLAGWAKAGATGARLSWRETNHLLLRRGPYVVAAGLDESLEAEAKELRGRFINLFDAELPLRERLTITPGSRFLLLDLQVSRSAGTQVLASAGKALVVQTTAESLVLAVEGVPETAAVVLLSVPAPPKAVSLAGQPWKQFEYSSTDRLLRIWFTGQASPRELSVSF
jgi:hypothetical protein